MSTFRQVLLLIAAAAVGSFIGVLMLYLIGKAMGA